MARSPAAVLATLLLLVAAVSAQDAEALENLNATAIDAMLPESTNKTTGVLLPNPPAPDCEVGVTLTFVNTSLGLQNAQQPTSSPVPSVVQANLTLQLANIGDADLEGEYTVTIEVPFGTLITNVTGGTVQAPRVGQNNTVAIGFTLNTPLAANGGNTTYLNMSVLAASQDFQPRKIAMDGGLCAIGLAANITEPVPPLPAPAPTADLPGFLQLGSVGVDGKRIIGVDGQPITLKGANWFGFETQANMVDGLWAGDSTLTADFATVAYRMQLLGINAIRLPFSFVVLFQSSLRDYSRRCRVASQAEIRSNVIDPRDAPSIPASAQPPSIVAPPATYGNGICSVDVPNSAVYTRFLYVIGYLARQGFYILIDNHLNLDPTFVNNRPTWVAQWTQLMRDINADPVAKNVVMMDLLNEPDSYGLRWADVSDAYFQVMDNVYQINPQTLFFIEGTGQQGPAMNWGDGFITDPNIISSRGISDPRPFFDRLLTKPYLNNMVISPHYYGPSISQNRADFTGPALAARATSSWGYLNTVGYGGHIFPVVIGEAGSQFIDPRDLDFHRDLSLYLNNQGYMNDGRHSVTRDLFWWSWNANSGDTGGLVDTTWANIIWNKTQYLETAIGLRPWSLLAATGALSPSPPPPAASPPPPVASPPPPVASPPPPVASPPPPVASPPPPVASPPPPVPAPSPEPVASPPPPVVSLLPSVAAPSPAPVAPLPSPVVAPSPAPIVSSPPPPTVASPSPPPPVTTPTASPPPPSQASRSPSPPPPVTTPAASPPPPSQASPSPSPPPPVTTPAASPPPPVAGRGAAPCAVRTSVETTWTQEGQTFASVQFYVSNPSPTSILTPYQLVIEAPGITSVSYTWNWQASYANGRVSGSSDANAGWQTLLPNNANTVNLGGIFGASSQDRAALLPSRVTVNGAACSLSS